MNHKQQIKYVQQQAMSARAVEVAEKHCDNIVNMLLLNMLIVLGDKFGFGKIRMSRFLKFLAENSANFTVERMYNTPTTPEDLKEVLLNEYKLDYDKEVQQAFENFKKDVKGGR